MGKKISKFLKGQITTSVFYIAFGLCLVLMPVKTVNILCKVVFGLVMIAAGLYHIFVFVKEKETATILDLFSGVIVLVIGGFLFTNPQVVIKLLPVMLGAFVLVDSIWTFRGGMKLRKKKLGSWKIFLLESLIFIGLGIFLVVYPFQTVNIMLMFAGWIFLCNGVLDVILYILLYRGMKKEITEDAGEKTEAKDKEEPVLQNMSDPEAGVKEGEDTDTGDAAARPEEVPDAEKEPLEEWKD